jgi:hypothetical protein
MWTKAWKNGSREQHETGIAKAEFGNTRIDDKKL